MVSNVNFFSNGKKSKDESSMMQKFCKWGENKFIVLGVTNRFYSVNLPFLVQSYPFLHNVTVFSINLPFSGITLEFAAIF